MGAGGGPGVIVAMCDERQAAGVVLVCGVVVCGIWSMAVWRVVCGVSCVAFGAWCTVWRVV